jgi:hypothetical protein
MKLKIYHIARKKVSNKMLLETCPHLNSGKYLRLLLQPAWRTGDETFLFSLSPTLYAVHIQSFCESAFSSAATVAGQKCKLALMKQLVKEIRSESRCSGCHRANQARINFKCLFILHGASPHASISVPASTSSSQSEEEEILARRRRRRRRTAVACNPPHTPSYYA